MKEQKLDEMMMPCLCDCCENTWFDYHEGFREKDGLKLICEDCHTALTIERCTVCNVPNEIHSKTCCGWSNANSVILKEDFVAPYGLADEDLEKRFFKWKAEQAENSTI